MKLEVGKTYRLRNGEIVTCVKFDGSDSAYPYLCNGNATYWYTSDGRFWANEGDSELDIVAEVTEEPGDAVVPSRPEASPLATLMALVDETNAACREIMRRKNHDYTSGSGDVLANFRASEVLGVPPAKGILLRSLDKFKRIQTFVEQGTLKVKGESVKDAIMDVINYMHLLHYLIEERSDP